MMQSNSVHPQRTLLEVLRWEAVETPLEMAWVGVGLYLTLGESSAIAPWMFAFGQLLVWTAVPFSFARRYGFYAVSRTKTT